MEGLAEGPPARASLQLAVEVGSQPDGSRSQLTMGSSTGSESEDLLAPAWRWGLERRDEKGLARHGERGQLETNDTFFFFFKLLATRLCTQ